MTSSRANVLLLRAPSCGTEDKYEAVFDSLKYDVSSVPVLETVLSNLDQLKDILAHGLQGVQPSAVICTSSRACQAWKEAVAEPSSTLRDWSKIPFYAVGHATAAALRAIASENPHSLLVPRDIRGEESGTGENLARYILDDLQGNLPASPMLFLTGDKNRDILPTLLERGGVKLSQQQVYETKGSSNFMSDLRAILETHSGNSWWIVFFAPSAAEFVLPALRQHFTFDRRSPSCVRVVAIGPTTSDYLHEMLHLHVDAVAAKPTAEELYRAIQSIAEI